MAHTSVLLKEIIENLDIKDNDVYLDCTLGNGGHALAIAESAKNVKVIGIDADETAITEATKNFLNANKNILTYNGYFDTLDQALKMYGIDSVDKVLFDLGLRSDQIDQGERGFSFKNDGPLKMTFSVKPFAGQVDAYEVVNNWKEETLADIIYGFGEERFSRRVARAIVEAREIKPIETTFELRDIVEKAVPRLGFSKISRATKTFQAIRIAVNNELERIVSGVNKAFEHLRPGGRLAVISFHSLEDRLIKNIFRDKVSQEQGELINKNIIIASDEERDENPRSRSAKLRIIKKI